MKRLIYSLLLCLAVVGCDGLDSVLYRARTMGYVQDDATLRADDGMVYVFSAPEWTAGERVYAVFDVTSSLGDGKYKANLLQLVYPLYKDPIVLDGKPAPDTLGTDGINVENVWLSGGCLNMLNSFTDVEGTSAKHYVNLTADSAVASGDTLHLRLWHRTDPPRDFLGEGSLYRFYTSFPVSKLIPESGFVLELSWNTGDKEQSITHAF